MTVWNRSTDRVPDPSLSDGLGAKGKRLLVRGLGTNGSGGITTEGLTVAHDFSCVILLNLVRSDVPAHSRVLSVSCNSRVGESV